jgi:hypothetical protein
MKLSRTPSTSCTSFLFSSFVIIRRERRERERKVKKEERNKSGSIRESVTQPTSHSTSEKKRKEG